MLENSGENKNKLIEEIKNKNDEIALMEQELDIYKETKEKKNNERIDLEKIKINENIKKEYEEKKHKIKNINLKEFNNVEEKHENNKKISKLEIVLIPLLISLNIIVHIINIKDIIKIGIGIATIILFIFSEYIIRKKIRTKSNKIKNEKNNQINIENIKLQNEINLLEENIEKTDKEICNLSNKLQQNKTVQINYLKDKYMDILNGEEINTIYNKDLKEIENEIRILENKLNNDKIAINSLYIEESNLNERMEEYSEFEERLEFLYTEKENLEKLNKTYELIKECLESAYYKMKNNITPKFTKELSNIVENISNNKYKNIKFKADEGLIVELENGEYINANRLSIGTIDQLYLSLRLSAMGNISQENMPIILDETFAYYDNERLENILKYLCENYKNNQIIIFTCNNREKEMLDRLQIKYNLINI